ncbi:MAG: hypothetical protein ACTHLJ_04045 [Angustibacter sp.]
MRAAAAELATAILAHAEAVAAATSDADVRDVFAASETLLPVVLAYSDAQFEHTGNAFPFGVLHQFEDDDEAAAAADVAHLGRALYQLAHADGWHSLDHVEGLRVTAGAVSVVDQDELLRGDPDEWPDDLFDLDGEEIFGQADVYLE